MSDLSDFKRRVYEPEVEALKECIRRLTAERNHYRDHSPAGCIGFEECEAEVCEIARESFTETRLEDA